MNNQAINPTDSRPTQRSLRAKGLLRFAVQVTANALAVMLVLTLLSQIHLQHGSLLTYLLVGLLFSLIDNLAKPLLIVLVGQLLIRSTGLFLIVVNASLFSFLIIFSPFDWTVAQPRWLWILVASRLLALLVAAVDAVLGLTARNGSGWSSLSVLAAHRSHPWAAWQNAR
ncbi:MAG: phage holin family protein [Anaerolineales bacterium]|nr:phage holin family protein [Anaerolineales bacterium]